MFPIPIGADEAALVRRAEEARADAIQVDSFSLEAFLQTAVGGEEDRYRYDHDQSGKRTRPIAPRKAS